MKQFRDKNGRGIWIRLLTLAAIVLAIVCCFTLFFQVEEIRTVGNTLYSGEQIVKASGISIGDSMVSIRKANAASLIRSSLPFIESVHIERILPDTVEITVTESDAVYAFRAENGKYYTMNSTGIVIEEIRSVRAQDYPNVEGVSFLTPTVGQTAQSASETKEGYDAALQLMAALSKFGLASNVRVIDVSKTYDIRVSYSDRFEVILGGTGRLAYKTEYLAAVIRDLESGASGILDLTFEEEDKARFQPF